MSPGFLGLLAAVAVLMLVTVLAVVWMNRTPTIERDADEILPLFSALGTPTVEESEQGDHADDEPSREPMRTPGTNGTAPTPVRAPAFGTSSYGPPPYAPSYNGAGSSVPASPAEQPNPSIRTFTTGAPQSASVAASAAVDRPLMHFTLPTEGTLQFLPGRLEITAGTDIGREIRFVRLPGPNGTEFTFGRSEGEPYRHIQLRDQTVSRAHARMRFHEGRWYLNSLSHTNPVVLDDAALTIDEEHVLNDGARIEMGEVLFTFKNR